MSCVTTPEISNILGGLSYLMQPLFRDNRLCIHSDNTNETIKDSTPCRNVPNHPGGSHRWAEKSTLSDGKNSMDTWYTFDSKCRIYNSLVAKKCVQSNPKKNTLFLGGVRMVSWRHQNKLLCRLLFLFSVIGLLSVVCLSPTNNP